MAYRDPSYDQSVIVYYTQRNPLTGLDERFSASGSMISNDMLLTAAHVLVGPDGTPSKDIIVASGAEASVPYMASGINSRHGPVNYTSSWMGLDSTANDFGVLQVSQPRNAGYMGLQPDFTNGRTTLEGYPATALGHLQLRPQVTTLNVLNPAVLDGDSLGPGGSGGAAVVEDGFGGKKIAGIASTEDPQNGRVVGHEARLTQGNVDQINAWVREMHPDAPALTIYDVTTGHQINPAVNPYDGGAPGITTQSAVISADAISSSLGQPNMYFASHGSGPDYVKVPETNSGAMVIDLGDGSGTADLDGTGRTLLNFNAATAATGPTRDTVSHLTPNEVVQIRGVDPNDPLFSSATDAGYDLTVAPIDGRPTTTLHTSGRSDDIHVSRVNDSLFIERTPGIG